MNSSQRKAFLFDADGSMKGAVSHFGFLGISKVLSHLTHLVFLAVITSQLGPVMFGKMNVFLMVTQFLFLVTAGWTANGYTRYAILHTAEGGLASEVFWCRNLIMLFIAGTATFAMAAGKPYLLGYLDMPSFSLWLIFLHVLALILVDYSQQVAQVTSTFKGLAGLQLSEKLLILLLVALFGRGIWEILIIIIAVTFCCRGSFLGFSSRGLYFPITASRQLCKRILRFSLPLLVVSLGGFIFGWVDVAVIKHFASLESVGIYFLAYSGLGTIESVVLLMTSILTPIAVSLAADERFDLTERMLKRFLPQIYYLWGGVFLLTAMVATPIVHVAFEQEFHISAKVFLLLLLSLHFSVLNALCLALFIGFDMVSKMAAINLASALLNLVLDLVLVPRFGIFGAAFATVAAYGAITIFYLRMLKQRFRLHFTRILPFVTISALQVIGLLWVESFWAGLSITMSAFCFYFLSGKRCNIFSVQDKADYSNIELPGVVRKLLYKLCDLYG